MPWPLSSSKPKPRPVSSGDFLHDAGALALEDASNDSGYHDRRSASLDISRPLNSNVRSVQDDAKRARRSSFPRLALPSWRTSAKQIEDGSAVGEDGGVELVSGHATPFSANGLRGGFVPDDISLSSRGSSSIRSGSVHSSYHERDGDEESGETGGSMRTGRSSRTNVMVSPVLTPVDSGFSEFGPDSVVQQEMERHSNVRPVDGSHDLAGAALPGEDAPPTEVLATTNSKRRSKGWFSFSSNNNGASTPTGEDTTMFVAAAQDAEVSDRVSTSHPSTNGIASSAQPQKDKSVPASHKPVTLAKGRLGFASRRRGNSEVSMKNVGED